jgi:DNA-directed RNA polymerase specialized sigma subunit
MNTPTDYDLYLNYKQKNDKESLAQLHSRYKKLIQKIYTKKIVCKEKDMDFEDFYQESFILFLKVVNYIDEAKLYDTVNWKLYSLFYFILNNYAKNKNIYWIKKFKSIVHLSEYEFDQLSSPTIDLNSLYMEEFSEKLSPLQKEIFVKRIMEDKSATLMELEKQLKVSKTTINRAEKSLAKAFKEEYF